MSGGGKKSQRTACGVNFAECARFDAAGIYVGVDGGYDCSLSKYCQSDTVALGLNLICLHALPLILYILGHFLPSFELHQLWLMQFFWAYTREEWAE